MNFINQFSKNYFSELGKIYFLIDFLDPFSIFPPPHVFTKAFRIDTISMTLVFTKTTKKPNPNSKFHELLNQTDWFDKKENYN